jgi:hypothetical protein
MSEQTEHEALADFLLRMEGRYPALAFVKHTPNEADGGGEKKRIPYTKRDGSQGWKMVPLETLRGPSRGIKPGVFDWEFLLPNQGEFYGVTYGWYHGIAIELKVGKNDLSPDQRRWKEHYLQNDWATYVCYDWTEAARLLILWVGGNPDDVEGL